MLCSPVPARKTSSVTTSAGPTTPAVTSSSHHHTKKEPVISPSSIPTPTTTTLPPPPIIHPHQLPSSQALPMSPNMLPRHHHHHHLAAAGLPPPPQPPCAAANPAVTAATVPSVSLPLNSSQISSSPARRNSSSDNSAVNQQQQQPQQRKEAPAFVRPFEDSFQPKPPPVAPRNSHTPPVMLTSPAPAALSSSLASKDVDPSAAAAVDSVAPQLNHCASHPPLLDKVKTEKLESSANNKLMASGGPLCVPNVPQPSLVTSLASEDTKPIKVLEPAVLNVPDKAKVLAVVKESAMSSWDYHAISKSLQAAFRVSDG